MDVPGVESQVHKAKHRLGCYYVVSSDRQTCGYWKLDIATDNLMAHRDLLFGGAGNSCIGLDVSLNDGIIKQATTTTTVIDVSTFSSSIKCL